MKKNSGSKGLKEGKFANMFNPLMPSAAYIRRSAKNFDFNLRRYKKNYGRPDYKPVDKKSLSYSMSRKTTKVIIQTVKG